MLTLRATELRAELGELEEERERCGIEMPHRSDTSVQPRQVESHEHPEMLTGQVTLTAQVKVGP